MPAPFVHLQVLCSVASLGAHSQLGLVFLPQLPRFSRRRPMRLGSSGGDGGGGGVRGGSCRSRGSGFIGGVSVRSGGGRIGGGCVGGAAKEGGGLNQTLGGGGLGAFERTGLGGMGGRVSEMVPAPVCVCVCVCRGLGCAWGQDLRVGC